jgi:hypothetical protein
VLGCNVSSLGRDFFVACASKLTAAEVINARFTDIISFMVNCQVSLAVMSIRYGVIPTPLAPAKLTAAEVINARFTDITANI